MEQFSSPVRRNVRLDDKLVRPLATGTPPLAVHVVARKLAYCTFSLLCFRSLALRGRPRWRFTLSLASLLTLYVGLTVRSRHRGRPRWRFTLSLASSLTLYVNVTLLSLAGTTGTPPLAVHVVARKLAYFVRWR